jgi:hypothetical protein
MISFGYLEMHVSHACNLKCESCSHFSSSGHRGVVSRATAKRWITPWKDRIKPAVFKLLGGEPTLNKDLADIITDSKEAWPNSAIHFSTNAFYIGRHPDLGSALGLANAVVTVSVHSQDPNYLEQVKPGIELLQQWEKEYGFKLYVGDGTKNWTRRHFGLGQTVKPFEGDQRKSWEACGAKRYPQLYDGKIWKCATTAYIRLTKKSHPSISSAWKPALDYTPLDPSSTDSDIEAWLKREDEPACQLCPTALVSFKKPAP